MKNMLKKVIRSDKHVYTVYPTKREFMEKIISYFKVTEVDEDGNEVEVDRPKPTISGLAVYLGFANKKYLKEMIDTEYGDCVEYGISMIEQYHEEKLYGNHTSGSSFWLKTQAGWFEQKEEEKDKVVNIVFDTIPEAEVIEDKKEELTRLSEVSQNLQKAGLSIETIEVEE